MNRYNPWKDFADLTAGEPRLVATVTTHHGDGSSTVTLLAGGTLRVRGQGVAEGDRCFIVGTEMDGPAPAGTAVEIEI